MATTTTNIRETLFLSEWIRRAIDGVDLSALAATNELFPATSFGADPSQWPADFRKSAALCSYDYLLSALRVARSLADQICEAEDIAAQDEYDGRGRDIGCGNYRKGLPSLPPPGSSWADSVLVHLLLEGNGKAQNDDNKLYFNIELLTATTEQGKLEDSMQRIHYLGMVFYEIFSGGRRPPELHQLKTETEGVSQELYGNLDPLPFDHDGPRDLGRDLISLSIFEDVPIPDGYNVQDVSNTLSPNPRKRQTQHENCDKFAVSVEPLKAMGIPRSLCDLIAKMMGCVNDTLGGEDAYESMSEVRSDLQLILDKPEIYLYDQDMGRFSTTGLQLSETMFGRKAELSTIIKAYRRSLSGEKKLVIISGPSGSGKSFLGHEFGNHVVAEGGIALYGKFDQLQQGKPFVALAAAFDQFCGNLIHDEKLNWVRQAVACQVITVMGPAAYHLTKIIPNLAIILGPEPVGFNRDEDCVNPQRRLLYLLCQFVQVISTSAGGAVLLFLDDLQWADAASIEAVSQLLSGLSPQKTHFFFLGCCREGQITKGHCTWKLLCTANKLGVGCTNVKLDFMDEENVNILVSETLGLLPRLTRALSSIIYHKTKGNPLFVSRMMLSLNKEGLLRASLSRKRWEWDKEKIKCQKLPDDVAMFLTRSIKVMPEGVKSSLCVLSCFGASVESALIKTLERALDKKLLDNLDVAVAEGFLDKTDDRYKFSHDRIQEAAYNMMTVRDRNVRHFQYGIALSSQLIGVGDDAILFAAANQLNLGGPEAIEDVNQNFLVATHDLRAGKKAMEMSDFRTAYSYFDHGISFLRKNHWKEHYSLSLELFDLASKCALANGDLVSLTHLSDHVLLYGHSFEDKLNVLYCTTCAMAFSSKLPESIEKGLDILAKLGIDLQGYDSSMEACAAHQTKDLLSGFTDDDILNTRRMTDRTLIMAMKFLGKLEVGMTQIIPKSVSFVAQKIIQLSLSHGLSPVSPIGFVHFGSCMAKLGDISGGYRYVKLALSLLDKVGSRESAGEVIFFCTQVRAYIEPLQATIKYHNDGYAAAMESGDLTMASVNRLCFCVYSFFFGANLQTLREKVAETRNMLEERNQVIFMIQIQFVQRNLSQMIGIEEESKSVSEEQTILATNISVMKTYYFSKTYISFMFRSYDDAKEYAEKYFFCSETTWANLLLLHAQHAFYIGLTSFWLARKSWEQQQRRQWYQRGNQFKVALERWAESSRWTFENKWYLLEAEESYCNNDFKAAKSFYEKAISSAKDHKFVNEEALANELAAHFYLETGCTELSIDYFLLAHEKYEEWGAIGKCNILFGFIQNTQQIWIVT